MVFVFLCTFVHLYVQINRFITAEPGLQEVTQGKNAQVHRTGIGNDVEYACS